VQKNFNNQLKFLKILINTKLSIAAKATDHCSQCLSGTLGLPDMVLVELGY